MIEITHKRTGKVLLTAPGHDLRGADLAGSKPNEADLTGANLIRANLTGADLTDADLTGADLTAVNMTSARLTGAFLSETNLGEADLSDARLDRAHWIGSDLTDAKLDQSSMIQTHFRVCCFAGAMFRNVFMGETILVNCVDLHKASHLDSVRHLGRSLLDQQTLRSSFQDLPHAFLKGVGYSNEEIEMMHGLYGSAFRFYSCFLSYARADTAFADRLYADLQSAGITCWKDDRDLRGGDYCQESPYTGPDGIGMTGPMESA